MKRPTSAHLLWISLGIILLAIGTAVVIHQIPGTKLVGQTFCSASPQNTCNPSECAAANGTCHSSGCGCLANDPATACKQANCTECQLFRGAALCSQEGPASAVCGNGIREKASCSANDYFDTPGDCTEVPGATEECDDGNTSNGDGCSSSCKEETAARCGDTKTQSAGADGISGNSDDEECDDGNTEDLDRCSNTCKLAKCGDNKVQTVGADGISGNSDDEQCDEGRATAAGTCDDADGKCNVPLSTANKDYEDVEEKDYAILKLSGCLETCKWAQCSDGKNNEDPAKGEIDDRVKDAGDPACMEGDCWTWNLGAYLPGFNSELNPCQMPDTNENEAVATTNPEDADMFAADGIVEDSESPMRIFFGWIQKMAAFLLAADPDPADPDKPDFGERGGACYARRDCLDAWVAIGTDETARILELAKKAQAYIWVEGQVATTAYENVRSLRDIRSKAIGDGESWAGKAVSATSYWKDTITGPIDVHNPVTYVTETRPATQAEKDAAAEEAQELLRALATKTKQWLTEAQRKNDNPETDYITRNSKLQEDYSRRVFCASPGLMQAGKCCTQEFAPFGALAATKYVKTVEARIELLEVDLTIVTTTMTERVAAADAESKNKITIAEQAKVDAVKKSLDTAKADLIKANADLVIAKEEHKDDRLFPIGGNCQRTRANTEYVGDPIFCGGGGGGGGMGGGGGGLGGGNTTATNDDDSSTTGSDDDGTDDDNSNNNPNPPDPPVPPPPPSTLCVDGNASTIKPLRLHVTYAPLPNNPAKPGSQYSLFSYGVDKPFDVQVHVTNPTTASFILPINYPVIANYFPHIADTPLKTSKAITISTGDTDHVRVLRNGDPHPIITEFSSRFDSYTYENGTITFTNVIQESSPRITRSGRWVIPGAIRPYFDASGNAVLPGNQFLILADFEGPDASSSIPDEKVLALLHPNDNDGRMLLVESMAFDQEFPLMRDFSDVALLSGPATASDTAAACASSRSSSFSIGYPNSQSSIGINFPSSRSFGSSFSIGFPGSRSSTSGGINFPSSRSSGSSFSIGFPNSGSSRSGSYGSAFFSSRSSSMRSVFLDECTVENGCLSPTSSASSSGFVDGVPPFGELPPGTFPPGVQVFYSSLSSGASVSSLSSTSDGLLVRDPNIPLYCGNGRVDVGEQCDLGQFNSDLPTSLCMNDCRLPGRPAGDNPTLPGSIIELPFSPPAGQGNNGGTTGGRPPSGIVGDVTNPPNHSPVGDTGPATVAIMAAGSAAGFAWMRKRRGKVN